MLCKLRIAFVCFAVITAAGCASGPLGVYRMDIQQGNVFTQEMVNQLRPGMTQSQVRFILGTPLINDTFSQERWDYFYSLRVPGDKPVARHLTLYFSDQKLARLSGDFAPKPDPNAVVPAPAPAAKPAPPETSPDVRPVPITD